MFQKKGREEGKEGGNRVLLVGYWFLKSQFSAIPEQEEVMGPSGFHWPCRDIHRQQATTAHYSLGLPLPLLQPQSVVRIHCLKVMPTPWVEMPWCANVEFPAAPPAWYKS